MRRIAECIMRWRNGFFAGALSIIMAVSSVPVSAASVNAEEFTEYSMTELITVEADMAYQYGGAPSVKDDSELSQITMYADDTSEVENYLYTQMLMRKDLIYMSAYNLTRDCDVRALFDGVINEHPDLYFVTKDFAYSYGLDGNLAVIYAYYYDTLDDDAFKRETQKALAVVNDNMTDLEKAIALHDYLTINCEYDNENYLNKTIPRTSYTAYGPLVLHIAVCEGYALAYKYLLNQVGIDCYMVKSSTMDHAWNMIKLDGEYYQVDVTWDDPTWDMIGRSMHNNMFRSDDDFGTHKEWRVTYGANVVDYKATDTRYNDAYWVNCNSPIVFSGNNFYYIDMDEDTGASTIKKGNMGSVTVPGTDITGNIGTWKVWDSPGYIWNGAFSGLFCVDNRLYYNDSEAIYSIAMDGSDKKTEFTADTTNGYIYGCALRNGEIVYVLHQAPDFKEKETILKTGIVFEELREPEEPSEPSESSSASEPNESSNASESGSASESSSASESGSAGESSSADESGSASESSSASEASESSSENESSSASDSDGIDLHVTFPEGKIYTYTGSPIKPAIKVTNNDEVLVEGTDYTVKYSNNTKAGAAKLTVAGKGRFTGKQDTTFTIEQKSLQDDDIVANDITIVANSKASPVVVYNGMKLGAKDYTPSDTGKIAEDKKLTIEGKGNYKDSIEINVKVVEKLGKFKVNMNKDKLVYNGDEQKLGFEVIDSKTKEPLKEDEYMAVYSEDITNAGTVKVTVVGLGTYGGSVTKSYKISPLKTDMELSFDKQKEYTFNSLGTTVDDIVVKEKDSGKELEYGKDYKISYSANKKAGTGKINVTFLGNYKGSKALQDNFEIKPAVLSKDTVDVFVPDKAYLGKKNAYKSVPIVTDESGNILKSSDYTVNYYNSSDMTEENEIKGKTNLIELDKSEDFKTVYVKVTGKGNYAGNTSVYATGDYKVKMTSATVLDLSKAKVTFKNKGTKVGKREYTGNAIEPDVEVTIKVKGAGNITLDESQYDIKWTNNINKGKATAVITGNGTEKGGYAFVGSKNATFNIVARNFKGVQNLFGKNTANFLKGIFSVN